MPDGPSEPLDSTSELIRRVRDGDRDSLERLVQRHLAPLRRYVSGRLPRWASDLADTDDLVQDTLLRTFSRMDAFEVRGAGALHAYLRQAVMNRLRDELRRKGRVPALVDVDRAGPGRRRIAARRDNRTGSVGAIRGGAGATRTGGTRSDHRTRGDGVLVRGARRDARQTDAGRGPQSRAARTAAPRRGNEIVSPELVLDEVADAILDGTPVDWSTIDLNDTPDRPGADRAAQRHWRRCASAGRLTCPSRWAPGTGDTSRLRAHRPGRVRRRVPRLGHAARSRSRAEAAACGRAERGASASIVIEEGRLLARVRHPNVVTIYGAERIDGRVGLWMEFVKGRTLEQALRSGRTFTAAEVTRLGVELCRAVSAVHAAGLLHRDIKAQNVMLDDDGRLVLMDFGTGRELDDAKDVRSRARRCIWRRKCWRERRPRARSDVTASAWCCSAC